MMKGLTAATAGALVAALLAAAPAEAGDLDTLLAGGGDLYSSGRDGAWYLADQWDLSSDGSLGGIRTAQRGASRGVTIFEYTQLEGRWWIDDGELCLDDNIAGQRCYSVSPDSDENRPDRFTGTETMGGRAMPLFIYPAGQG